MGKKVKKEVTPPPKNVFDPLTIESRKTGTVVLMLKSDEEEVLQKACEAVYRFADKCDENKLLLLEMGAMEAIANLINHEDKIVKRYAVMAYGVTAGNAEVRQQLRKTNAIEAAVQLLGDEDDVCNEFGSLFLAHMSNEYNSKLAIYKHEGMDRLINLLESPDPDIQKNCLQAVCNLVQDFQIRGSVRELGGVPTLLDLLKSDYAIIQELSLNTLCAITQDGETRAALREQDGLEQLVDFLNRKEYEDLHVNALHVISNCLEDHESLDEFRNSGGMEKLLIFTTESATPEVQIHAAHAMARAAKNVENAKILHEQEVEKTLITMCASDNEKLKIAVCQAICTLSENLAARDAFGKLEGIAPLIHLMQSESGDVKEAATLALANLTLNHKNNCLTDIQKGGLIAALTEPLKSDSVKILRETCRAIACFVTGSESRAELRKHEALEHLVQHLRSTDAQLQRNASFAILSTCVDAPTAAAVSNLGALEILQQINTSDQRRNNYSVAALDKLLDSNLPAKYSLTGKLSPHNIITDGFYDAGLIRPDGKVLPLEEMAKEPVNQRRPIIVINSKTPEPPSSSDDEDSPLGQTDLSESQTDTGLFAASDATAFLAGYDAAMEQLPRKSVMTPSQRSEATSSAKSAHDEANEKRVNSKASLTRRMKKKDKEAAAKEEAERLLAERLEQAYRPPVDTALQGYFNDVKNFIAPMATMREQIVALAQYVVEKMGEEVERGKLMDFTWELHIAELKFDLQSNIIPIGKIRKGTFYHRALLFKVLADSIVIPCSLELGQYNRAWNEVMVSSEESGSNFPPFKYIVDLMHDPGRLIKSDSPDAVRYRSL